MSPPHTCILLGGGFIQQEPQPYVSCKYLVCISCETQHEDSKTEVVP